MPRAHLIPRLLGSTILNHASGESNFTPEQEAQIAEIAARTGTNPEAIVKDATMRLLNEDTHFRAAVLEAKVYADRGEFIEEEAMDARLEEMLRS